MKMAHSIFNTLTGVALEESNQLTVQQFLDPLFIPPNVNRNKASSSTEARDITQQPIDCILDEDDVFQCGKCKTQFSNLERFMLHKSNQCSTLATKCLSLPSISSNENCNSLQEDNSNIPNEIHVHVQPSTSQIRTDYESCNLSNTQRLNNHVIVNEAELLNFTIESDQDVTPSVMRSESPNMILSDLESPPNATTQQNMKVELVEQVVNETTTPKTDVNSFNHDFFHGGMAKTSPSNKSVTTKSRSLHKCQFCSKEFYKNFDLQQHIRSHTGEKPFQCVVCGRAFAQKSNVKKHLAKHRVWPQGNIRSALPSDSIWVQQGITENDDESVLLDNSYACQLCDSKFEHYNELRAHMKVHNEHKVYKCIQKNCSATYPELEAFLDHVKSHGKDVEYTCHTCSKIFHSLEELGEHYFEHSVTPHPRKRLGPSYYRCTKCMNKYSSREALEYHLKTSSHNFPCQHCSKVFSTRRLLRRHLNQHGNIVTSVCSQCGKHFKSEYSMKLHQLIHTGEKPYQCQLCFNTFNRRDKLTRHMLIHGPKKFTCPLTGCTRAFNRSDKLQLHIRTHKKGDLKWKDRDISEQEVIVKEEVKLVKEEDESSSTSHMACTICDQMLTTNKNHKCIPRDNLVSMSSPQNKIDTEQDPKSPIKNGITLSRYEEFENENIQFTLEDPNEKDVFDNPGSNSLIKIETIKDDNNLLPQTITLKAEELECNVLPTILDLNRDKVTSQLQPNMYPVNEIGTQFQTLVENGEGVFVSNSFEGEKYTNYRQSYIKEMGERNLSLNKDMSVQDDTVCETICNLTKDGKNIEIICIPFHLTRSIGNEIMMNYDLTEKISTENLSETNQQLLVSNVENSDDLISIDSISSSSVLKENQAFQVISSNPECTNSHNINSVSNPKQDTILEINPSLAQNNSYVGNVNSSLNQITDSNGQVISNVNQTNIIGYLKINN